MKRTFSLAHLTALSLTPADLIRVAARVGYDAVGLRLLPAAPNGPRYDLMNDAAMLAQTKCAVAETNIAVVDLEIIRIGEAFDASAYDAFFDVGAQLGATHVLVAGDDDNQVRLTQHFAALCERARRFKLTCDLECMPWTAVKSVSSAHRIVENAGQSNGGVLIDALHFFRSQSSFEDVHAIAPMHLNYMQIADSYVPAPRSVDQLIHDARSERLLPSEGAFDLRGLLAAMPNDLPVSVEIPNVKRVGEIGVEAWAGAALNATRQLLEKTIG